MAASLVASKQKRWLFVILILTALFLFAGCSANGDRAELVLYTTTSVYDSGLLDYLLQDFNRAKVKVVAVGTGEALRNAELGNADLVLVHAPDLEAAYIEKGVIEKRIPIAINYFLITGPEEDPAKVADAKTAAEALKKIFMTRSPFVSRGDNSGTHLKELSLWEKAGVHPEENPNYLESGQGMAETLRLASEKRAYTLTDPATFAATKGLDLKAFSIKDKELINIYSVGLISRKVIGEERYGLARELFAYLTSDEALKKIESFAKKFKDATGVNVYEPVTGEN